MSQSRTYELSIFPNSCRSELLEFLDELGIDDYVEAATDSINADDVDWEKVLFAWSERDDSPLLLYRSTEEELEGFLKSLVSRFGTRVAFSGKWLSDRLWQDAWEPGFQFLETETFFIGPKDVPAPPQKFSIRLRTANVFGSGQHATTQALIRLMEEYKSESGSFLDVGTGTGVLALAAHHLGYSHLLGTDIEDNAIEEAALNAEENAIPLSLLLGSLPATDLKWDGIACNILPPTLTDLLSDLVTRLKPGGRLYLAGFHEANSSAVEAELQNLGLRIVEEKRERGWLAWLAMRI